MAVIVRLLWGTGRSNWMVDPMAFELFPINSPHCEYFSVLHILNCFMPFAVKLQVEKITIWVESKI